MLPLMILKIFVKIVKKYLTSKKLLNGNKRVTQYSCIKICVTRFRHFFYAGEIILRLTLTYSVLFCQNKYGFFTKNSVTFRRQHKKLC